LVQELENISANQIIRVLETGSITENIAAIARDDSATALQNTPVDIDVLANDTDADGDPLTLSIFEVPNNGTVTINDNNTAAPNDDFVTYIPNIDFSGTDQFVYQIDDSTVTDTATVSITVDALDPVNTSPAARNDSAATLQDIPVNINVLANDTDADGDPLILSIAEAPSNGTVSINDNNTDTDPSDDFVTYTPNAGFNGTDQFVYQVNDSSESDVATVTVTVDDIQSNQSGFLLGLDNAATLNSTRMDDEDIVLYDGNNFSLFFDGSDVGLGLPKLRITAFDMISDTEILMSLNREVELEGIGLVDDSDIVKFTATALGETTQGSFELYFDGSDVELSANSEDIDALTRLPNGTLIISTRGGNSVPGIADRGNSEDLLAFSPSSLGETTNGSWSTYLDGSDVELEDRGKEDIDAVSIDSSGRLLLSTAQEFLTTGISGADEDVFAFLGSSTGPDTAGSFGSELLFDGSNFGLSYNDIRGLDFSVGSTDFIS